MGLGNFTAVCTYIFIYSVLYTLRMELQGNTSKFWQKIFKVLSSRLDMVIYVFFPVFYQL